MKLTTPRLYLREFAYDDWAPVLAYQSTAPYLRYYPWTERDAADVQTFVRLFVDDQRPVSRHYPFRKRYQLALCLADQHTLIGNCGIRIQDRKIGTADIGYEIDPAFWGKGYATEAAAAIIQFGFESLKIKTLHAECIAENLASIRVLEKLRFQPTGHLNHHQYFRNRWWSIRLFTLHQQEWYAATHDIASIFI